MNGNGFCIIYGSLYVERLTSTINMLFLLECNNRNKNVFCGIQRSQKILSSNLLTKSVILAILKNGKYFSLRAIHFSLIYLIGLRNIKSFHYSFNINHIIANAAFSYYVFTEFSN